MITRKYPIIALLLLCSLLPISGYSQFFYYYANPFAFGSQITRYTSGNNIIFVNGTFKGLVPKYGEYGEKLGDTVVSTNVSGIGAGAAIGITLPIARTGKRSSYDLSIDFHYNSYYYTDVDKGVFPAGSALSDFYFGTSTATNQIALPLSIDLKWGSDAIAKRTCRFGGLLGVGGMPQYNTTTYTDLNPFRELSVLSTKSGFTVTPFVKAEISAYALFCFRLKVFYSLGKVPLFEKASLSSSTGQTVSSTLTNNSSLVISVCALPFSYIWHKERKSHGWWDDFESEEAIWKR